MGGGGRTTDNSALATLWLSTPECRSSPSLRSRPLPTQWASYEPARNSRSLIHPQRSKGTLDPLTRELLHRGVFQRQVVCDTTAMGQAPGEVQNRIIVEWKGVPFDAAVDPTNGTYSFWKLLAGNDIGKKASLA